MNINQLYSSLHGTGDNFMKAYLHSLKTNSAWDEETAVATIKSIMNHYMGEPASKTQLTVKR